MVAAVELAEPAGLVVLAELHLGAALEVVLQQETLHVQHDEVAARAGEVLTGVSRPNSMWKYHVDMSSTTASCTRRHGPEGGLPPPPLVVAAPSSSMTHAPWTPSMPSCGSCDTLFSSWTSNAHSRSRPPADPSDRPTRPLDCSASGGSPSKDAAPAAAS